MSDDLVTRHRAVMPNWLALYYKEPIEIVGAEGRRVTDSAGKTYLDFFAGILTNAIGYDVAFGNVVANAHQRRPDAC